MLDFGVKVKMEASNVGVRRGDTDPKAGKNELHFSGPKTVFTDCDLALEGVPKFVAPFSCTYSKTFFTKKPVGMLNLFVRCETDEDFEDLSNLWKLPVVKFFCETYNKTAGFTPAVKNSLIPDLRGMTVEQSHAALGLTEEEVGFLATYFNSKKGLRITK